MKDQTKFHSSCHIVSAHLDLSFKPVVCLEHLPATFGEIELSEPFPTEDITTVYGEAA